MRSAAAAGSDSLPARGEAGAVNMADAHARVNDALGVAVTSTGTGSGNAAGALVEALSAETPLLHLTGQIDTPHLDRGHGFIHETKAQLDMLAAVSKRACRVTDPRECAAVMRAAVRTALTPAMRSGQHRASRRRPDRRGRTSERSDAAARLPRIS